MVMVCYLHGSYFTFYQVFYSSCVLQLVKRLCFWLLESSSPKIPEIKVLCGCRFNIRFGNLCDHIFFTCPYHRRRYSFNFIHFSTRPVSFPLSLLFCLSVHALAWRLICGVSILLQSYNLCFLNIITSP